MTTTTALRRAIAICEAASPYSLPATDVVHALIDDDVSALDESRDSYDVEQYAHEYEPIANEAIARVEIARDARTLRVPMTHVAHDDEYIDVLAYRVEQEIAQAEGRLADLRRLSEKVQTRRSTREPLASRSVKSETL